MQPATPRHFHAIVASVALATAVWSTWPVAAHLRDHVVDGARVFSAARPELPAARNLGADVLLDVWIVSWALHAMVAQPTHPFDANIYHPEPLSLARSENLFAIALLGAPGSAIAGPVAAHQSALLLGIALGVWTTAWVVARWSGSLLGGLVAGLLCVVTPVHQRSLFHIQTVVTAWLPLVVFGLERFGATGLVRWALLAAAALVLQVLSGQYVGYYAMAAWLVIGSAVLLWGRAGRGPSWRTLGRDTAWLGVAGAIAGLLLLPVALPYLRLRDLGNLPGAVTGPGGGIARVGTLWAYLVPGLAGAWVRIGPWTLCLSIAGLAALLAGGRSGVRHASILALLAGLGALLSRGPMPQGTLVFDAFAALLPGFGGMRNASRAALLPHLAAAMLAGLGAAALASRWGRRGALLAIALAALALAGSWRGPVPLRRLPVGDSLPPAYRFLALCGAGDPLLELPAWIDAEQWREAERVYLSTAHWLPLLNGEGYAPHDHRGRMELANRLPSAEAVTQLRAATGLRWVLVHCDPESAALPGIAQLCAGQEGFGVARWRFGSQILYDLGRVAAAPEGRSSAEPADPKCMVPAAGSQP